MARINDHQLVQRVEDSLVVLDESTGAEIEIKHPDVARLALVVAMLFPEEIQV